jgi:hypothetical protein
MYKMKKVVLISLIAIISLAAGILLTASVMLTGNVMAGGFDDFGYNYNARVFVGEADGVDKLFDGTVWGDSTYAKDHLVMKWSKAWDDARFNGRAWTPDAWEDNEWNGAVPGGSGEVWHYKIKWVGACGAEGTRLSDGGYCIWGQFEVLMDQGISDGEHEWYAKAIPAGYGAP